MSSITNRNLTGVQQWQRGWLECAKYVQDRVDSGDIIDTILHDLEAIASTAGAESSGSRSSLQIKRTIAVSKL